MCDVFWDGREGEIVFETSGLGFRVLLNFEFQNGYHSFFKIHMPRVMPSLSLNWNIETTKSKGKKKLQNPNLPILEKKNILRQPKFSLCQNTTNEVDKYSYVVGLLLSSEEKNWKKDS